MPTHDLTSYRDPLDLLHRFVPTPLTMAVPFPGASVALQTNDLSFFPAHASSGPAPELAPPHHADDQPLPSCLWKIVRDSDILQPLTEASLLTTADILVYSMGPACIIAADRGHRELLAFLGAAVNPRAYQDLIFPVLCRLTHFVIRPTSSSAAYADLATAPGDHCNA